MIRERLLTAVLGLVGVFLLAAIYPLWRWLPNQTIEQMLGGIYVAFGIFLLLASRNRLVNRGLIAFTAWLSLAHATMMAVLVFGR
jgi:hypothetical protein